MPTLDGSSPVRFTISGNGAGTETGTSASFTPPANSVITVSAAINSAVAATPTFNNPTFSGTGVGAFAVARSQINASGGSCCIWRAVTTGTPTAGTVSISVTTSGSGTSGASSAAKVDVWTSVDLVQTGAAVNGSTSTTQNFSPTVTTVRAGSRVIGIGIDWSAGGAPTSSDTIDAYTVAGQTSGGRAIKAADSGAAGSVALNFNAAAGSPIWTVALLEIFASANASVPRRNIAGPGKHPGPRRFGPIARGVTTQIASNNLTLSIDTAGALTIAGQSITASIGLALSTQGALTIAGQTITPALTIPVTNGALTIAGQTATFAIGVAQSTQGAITVAGQSVPLSLAVPVTNGAVTIAGQSAAFAINEAISTAGQITFNGQTVALDLAGNLTLSIEPGAIGIAGQTVQLDLTGDTAPPTQTPAGGSRTRQRRYVIRVDGKIFQADSEAEAVAILQQVAALADKAALNKADEIVERALPKAISLGAVKPIAIKAPALSAPGLSAAAEAAQQAIERAYANASAAAELRLLMAVLAAEEDEEEFLLLH